MSKPLIPVALLASFLSLVTCSLLRADFTPIVGWDQQLFPSFVVGTAALKTDGIILPEGHLGDPHGLLGIRIDAPGDDTRIDLTIDCGPFAESSQFVGTLPKQGQTYSVFPKIKYNFEALSQCFQATPANVTYRLQINDGPILEKTVTMTVRPINDCPIKIRVGDEVIDRSFTFATFVNEQHPFTDKLLREALDIGVVDSFSGYQANSEAEVIKQVYAIWDVLVARDVRYSSITKTASDSEQILSQNVRLLEDTINNQQANCIDGSVLLVSLLRKIEIESFLILVPGHCYVGFYLDRKQTRILAIETTLVGTTMDEPETVAKALNDAVEEDLRGEYSWPSFVQALEVGTQNWIEGKEKFAAESETEYRIIDVAAARRLGVLPMPFRGKEEFLHFDHSETSRYASVDEGEEGDESDEDADDVDSEDEYDDEEESDEESGDESEDESDEDEYGDDEYGDDEYGDDEESDEAEDEDDAEDDQDYEDYEDEDE